MATENKKRDEEIHGESFCAGFAAGLIVLAIAWIVSAKMFPGPDRMGDAIEWRGEIYVPAPDSWKSVDGHLVEVRDEDGALIMVDRDRVRAAMVEHAMREAADVHGEADEAARRAAEAIAEWERMVNNARKDDE